MVSIYHPSYFITAYSIDYTPERYVPLENPDKHTLEAINSGWSEVFLSWDETGFDELYYRAFDEFGNRFGNKPFYFRYNGIYYDMGMVVGDRFPPAGLPFLLLAGLAASVTAIVIIGFYKAAKHVKGKLETKGP